MNKADRKTAYLDNACIGKPHKKIIDTAYEITSMFSNMEKDPTDLTMHLYEKLENGRKRIADILNVEGNTVCFVESTSHGLGMIANSIDLDEKDNVLVCDLEFCSTVFCWKRRQQKTAFEIRPVKTDNGQVTADDYKSAADKNTKVIIVSSVQEVNGYRVDIKEISKFARDIGAYIIVDGIQEMGALSVDLKNLDVDAYCAGGHKWLRNPFGAGVLYINKNLVNQLEPDFYSYYNANSPPGGWGNYLESPQRTPYDHFEMKKDASKFETGATINYVGAFGLVKSFEIIEGYGLFNIEKEVIGRIKYIKKNLKDIGALTNDNIDGDRLSGICTFNLEEGIEKEKQLMEILRERNIYCSLRYVSGIGGIRISPHYYTAYDEIDYFIETVRDFISGNI